MEDQNKLFVLAHAVEFIEAGEVGEKIKHRISIKDDDVVISCAGSRLGSKIISREFSLLMKAFRQPQSLAQAIFNYSVTNDRDATEVAEEVYDMLLSMQYAGFLVPEKNNRDVNKDKLQPGSLFRGYTVLKKVYGYDDTQVYQVKDAAEKKYALKLLTAHDNQHVVNLFYNEIKVLNKLDGSINPELKEKGEENNIPFLITAWCDGEPSTAAAVYYRNINSKSNAIKLLDISIAIIKAFEHLHKQGVIHGDIQGPNIFISKKEEVKIIDYGYAVLSGDDKKMIRGGNGFFFEPEYSAAYLENKLVPAVTEKAEQYSLAVLLYQIITGYSYIDFAFEKDGVHEQIKNASPISLKELDLPYPSSLNTVFAKALSKKAADRFDSVHAFAEAMQQVRNEILQSHNFFIAADSANEENFTSYLIHKFGWNSALIENGLAKPPTRSVNYGAAGIAYMYYRVACIRQDSNLINLADTWSAFALQYENDFDKSFYAEKIGITQKNTGTHSMYHSPAGVYLVQALISFAKNDYDTLAKSVQSFANAVQGGTLTELVMGKSGLLLGCSLLYRELKSTALHLDMIKKLAEALLQELWLAIDKEPAMNTTNTIKYFGIAHGWAGLLYATLHWCSISGTAVPPHFYNRVEEWMASVIKKDGHIYFPISHGNKNYWPGWCNGNAGHIFLLTLLYKYNNDDTFLQTADVALKSVIKVQHQTNNLCCGISGITYSALALYNSTGEKKYITIAQKLKQSIIKNISPPYEDNNSLYKGEVGVGLLFCESTIPVNARMPLFE